jgi:hypothetical protein
MIKQVSFLLTLLLSYSLLFAIEYDAGINAGVTNIGVHSRQLGMGNAYCGVADDVSAVFYNAAGLTKLYKSEFTLTQIALFDDTNCNFVGFVKPTISGFAYGIGYSGLSMINIRATDEYNFETGQFVYSNSAVTVSVAKSFSEKFSMGLNFVSVTKSLGTFGSSSESIPQVCLLYTPGKRFGIGLNAGDKNVKFGFGYKIIDGKKAGLLYVADLDKTGDVKRTILHTGLELSLFNLFSLRAGMDDNNMTAGFGCQIKNMKLDFAMLTHPELGPSSRVTMGFMFGRDPEARKLAYEEWLKKKAEKREQARIAKEAKEQAKLAAATAAEKPAATPAAPAVPRKKLAPEKRLNLAVIDFDGKNVSAADASAVTDLIRTDLVKSEVFNIIDRANMETILGEQKFQMSGCTTEECAIQMGKLLNVQKMITGKLSFIQGIYHISLSVVDVETSKIEFSDRVTYKQPEEIDIAISTLLNKIVDFYVK